MCDYLLLLWAAGALLFLTATVHAQGGVLFPDTGTPSSTESCVLPSGATGQCKSIIDCPVVLQNLATQRPKICHFQGRIPIVCCPTGSIQLKDISPPATNFECGKATQVKYINFNGHIRSKRAVIQGKPELQNKPSLAGPGVVESTRNAWPWMTLLGQDRNGERSWFCSGVLLNRQWVLTAAHCPNNLNVSWVRLGEHDYSDDSDGGEVEDVGVAEVIYYPGYRLPKAYHDIALIRLTRPINLRSEVSPICLPWGSEADLPLQGSSVTITGWGARHFGGSLSPVLNEVNVTVLQTDVCANSYSTLADYPFNYPESLGEESLCIGDDQGNDSCEGDSGGPAVLRRGRHYTLVGIVSKGFGCGKKAFPGIYVSVQYREHLAWIKRVAFSST